jgi:hypothetical protein
MAGRASYGSWLSATGSFVNCPKVNSAQVLLCDAACAGSWIGSRTKPFKGSGALSVSGYLIPLVRSLGEQSTK